MKIFLSIFILSRLLFAFSIEQEFNVKTINVKEKEVSSYKEFYGKIVSNSENVYDVNLRFDGFITRLQTPNEFTLVQKGDKLFEVYSQEINNLFDELEIAKDRSTTFKKAIEEKFTLYDLNPENKVSNGSISIESKFNGFITKKTVNEGSFIKKGSNIFEITDLENVWAIINIYQKDIASIKLGMTVDIKIDGIKKVYSGIVNQIYPAINSKDQSVQVKVILENPKYELFPNMFLKAKIYQTKETAIVIPHNAVVKRDGKQYVFFKDGTTYTPSEIKAEKTLGGYKIIEGLSRGDTILMNALFLLDSDAVTNGLYSDDW